MEIELVNGKETVEFLEGLEQDITSERQSLFRSLGSALVANVKRRIQTSDGGTWAPASKWLRAKSGQRKVLLGAEQYVRYTMSQEVLKILGKPNGNWTLSQHHEGFENELIGEREEVDDHGRVVLKIRDPGPLGLYPKSRTYRTMNPALKSRTLKRFAFVPQRVARTPARKIWPTVAETEAIAEPIASRWLNAIMKKRGVVLLHE